MEWFESNRDQLKQNENGENLRSSFLTLPFFEKYPDWEKSHDYTFPDGRKVLEINLGKEDLVYPMEFKERFPEGGLEDKMVQNLLLVEDSSGDGYSVYVARYYPETVEDIRDFETLNYAGLSDKWQGKVEIFGYGENHLMAFHIEDGRAVRHSRYVPGENKVQSSENASSYCYTIWSGGNCYGIPHGISCQDTWDVVCSVNVPPLIDGSGGSGLEGGGGGGPNPGNPGGNNGNSDPSVICNGPACLPMPGYDLFELILDPSFVNTKAHCVYNRLRTLSVGFQNAIRKFDGEFPVAHLKFSVDNNLPNSTNAVTSNAGEFLIDIKINGNTLTDRTYLGLARTLVHEVMHAEIYRKVKSVGGVLSINDFPGIYDYYRRHVKNDWQHQLMATHYRETIVSILKELDGNQYTEQFYNDLAWEGLQGTIAWSQLSNTEKSRIINQILNYKNVGNKNCN